jgi:cyclopropane fatty-acyl-phospholipid synthase-like methyltransferase
MGRIAKEGLTGKAKILCCDYREIPNQRFDKIASIEMVEHVGVKNLQAFYDQAYSLLTDNGVFLLQWTGLRKAMKPEDLIWGLFMNRHVFPGADASLPAHRMLKSMEKSNFEVHSVENVTHHYGLTLNRWHDNWVSNQAAITAAYGDRWFRIWSFFLAWSTIVAEQGNAACFQVVMNKNLDEFDRHRWISQDFVLGERAKAMKSRRPELNTPSVNHGSKASQLVQ